MKKQAKKYLSLLIAILMMVPNISVGFMTTADSTHITRAEFVQSLVKAYDLEAGNGNAGHTFLDIQGHPHEASIAIAYAFGLVEGYMNRFRPDAALTREEAAVILNRANQVYFQNETSLEPLLFFIDKNEISTWAEESVAILSLKGIIKGYPDGTFKGRKPLTHKEAGYLVQQVKDTLEVVSANPDLGPEKGLLKLNKDVVVHHADAHLKNLEITGRLLLSERIGSGDVRLENVNVSGSTFVRGGGTESIHILGGSFGDFILEETPGGAVRIFSQTTAPIRIVVSEKAAGQKLILEGIFSEVLVLGKSMAIETLNETQISNLVISGEATSASINLSDRTVLDKIAISAPVKVTGKGMIKEAVLSVDPEEVAFEREPEKRLDSEGKVLTQTPVSTPVPVLTPTSPEPPVTPPALPNPPVEEIEPSDELTITGELGEGFFAGSTRNVYIASNAMVGKRFEANEVWAVPIRFHGYGSLQMDLFERKVVAPIGTNGKFSINIEDLEEADQYVLLLVDTTEPSRKDHIQGFVALSNPNAYGSNLISMPVHDLSKGLKLGLLRRIDNEAVAELGIVEAAESFNAITVEHLLELAETGNALKALKNYYINQNPETGEQFTYTLGYYFDLGELPVNTFSESFHAVAYNGFHLFARTNQGDPSPKFFRPPGSLEIEGETYGPDRPVPLGVSHDGGSYYSYFINYSRDVMPKGFWTLEDEAGNHLGYFDFSLTPFMTTDKQPLGYVPNFKVNASDNHLESFEVQWLYANGHEVKPATNTKQISSSIRGGFLSHWNAQPFSVDSSGPYPFVMEPRTYHWELARTIEEAKGKVQTPEIVAAIADAEVFLQTFEENMNRLDLYSGSLNVELFGIAFNYGWRNPELDWETREQLWLQAEQIKQAILNANKDQAYSFEVTFDNLTPNTTTSAAITISGPNGFAEDIESFSFTTDENGSWSMSGFSYTLNTYGTYRFTAQLATGELSIIDLTIDQATATELQVTFGNWHHDSGFGDGGLGDEEIDGGETDIYIRILNLDLEGSHRVILDYWAGEGENRVSDRIVISSYDMSTNEDIHVHLKLAEGTHSLTLNLMVDMDMSGGPSNDDWHCLVEGSILIQEGSVIEFNNWNQLAF